MINHPNQKKSGERAVLVTTIHKGIFFGYAVDTNGPTIFLRACRNCIYYPPETKGFLGLASNGPTSNAKIGPAADFTVRDITGVAEVTDVAVEAWELAPWAR